MVISVDTGNKQIKTVHKIFAAGLVESDTHPPFGGDVLLYKGKYYALSDAMRIPYMRDKTEDIRYFILTLFAIAYELRHTDAYDSDGVMDVQLLIGLPPSHYGTLRAKYEKYFMDNGYSADFEFNREPYSISVNSVYTFPQAFAAIVPIISDIKQYPKVVIVDIGGYTADLLQLKHGTPDLSVCESLEYGTIKFYNKVKNKVNSAFDRRIDESDIDSVLNGNETLLGDEISALITKMGMTYITDFLNQLREMEIDLKTCHTIFVGGGSILFRPFIEQSREKLGQWSYIDHITANAKGYEILYNAGRR